MNAKERREAEKLMSELDDETLGMIDRAGRVLRRPLFARANVQSPGELAAQR